MRKRIKYSQNFLKGSGLARDLLNSTNISAEDTVLEIGAGEGIITQALLKKAGKVIAFELDKNFFDKLTQKFGGEKKLKLLNQDFLTFNLPNYPYKIFSNIPFNITAAIVKKITLGENPPQDSYLIIQKEAAAKFMGKPLAKQNSQIAVLLYPWFEFRLIHEFKAEDFFPKPAVKTILLEIKKREAPLIKPADKDKYFDFITYSFNRFKPYLMKGIPSKLNLNEWIYLFNTFLKTTARQQNLTQGVYAKQLKQQEHLKKIHRTRVDKNWRKC